MDHLLRPHDAIRGRFSGLRIECRFSLTFSQMLGGAPCSATQWKGIAVAPETSAELGFADARRVCQHRLEHRLQLAGRARDDVQHLRGRGLLLQRLGEILVRVGCSEGVLAFVPVERRLPALRSSPPYETRSPRRQSGPSAQN